MTAVAGLPNRLTHVGLSLHFAHQQALARMYSMVMVQAQAISYVEVYWLLAVGYLEEDPRIEDKQDADDQDKDNGVAICACLYIRLAGCLSFLWFYW
jgi:hypothetical protein